MSDTDTPRPSAELPGIVRLAGILLLLAAMGATGTLAAEAVFQLTPPGCGEGSGCDQATRSIWARVPGVGWPVSVLAFSYFLAVAVGWAGSPRISNTFAWIVRAGAAGSAVYLFAMVAGGYVCKYCLVAHISNFVFLGVVEWARAATRGQKSPAPAMGVTFVAIAAALLTTRGVLESQAVEQAVEETVKQITTPTAALTTNYAGRHHIGPETAPIRIVVYSDYQCPDCRRIDGAISDVLEERRDVVLSSRHFPMCADCNKYMNGRTLHGNACWAARAAEAAALLHGPEGFREMHEWLFEIKGQFPDQVIHNKLDELGWNKQEFLSLMQSQQTLDLVRSDVDEAKSLGVFFTPLVFVNGVELKWRSGRAITDLIEAVAASNPESKRFDADPLPLAANKMISDWAEGRVLDLTMAAGAPALGATDPAVDIIVWGDLAEKNTARLHGLLRDIVSEQSDVRYRFMHYPVNKECNAAAQSTQHEQACIAARAAEAAQQLGGDDAFWAMVDWITDNLGGVTEARLSTAAAHAGVDGPALLAQLGDDAIDTAISRDATAASRLGVRFIPMVTINSRRADRWQMPDGKHDILGMLIEQARSE